MKREFLVLGFSKKNHSVLVDEAIHPAPKVLTPSAPVYNIFLLQNHALKGTFHAIFLPLCNDIIDMGRLQLHYIESNFDYNRDYICIETSSEQKQNPFAWFDVSIFSDNIQYESMQ